MWDAWESKLIEFEKWRTEKVKKSLRRYWIFLRREFIKEVPVAEFDQEKLCLDVGCGPGAVLCPIVKDKFYVGTGIDPILGSSLEILKKRAHEEMLSVHITRGVGEYLPFKNSCVDVVLMTGVLDHTLDPGQVIREIHRVLSKHGILLILSGIVLEKSKDSSDRTHLHQFTIRDLYDLLNRNKLSIKRIRLLYRIPPLPHPLRMVSSALMRYAPRLYNLLGRLFLNPQVAIITSTSSFRIKHKADSKDFLS